RARSGSLRYLRRFRAWSGTVSSAIRVSSSRAPHGERFLEFLRHRPMTQVQSLRVKIFADGADYDGIVQMSRNPLIKGFTTNPTLMRKAGITNYEDFARRVLDAVPDRPISFEVLADDPKRMIAQGRRIASWSPNANVKVPVTNTAGVFAREAIRVLSAE